MTIKDLINSSFRILGTIASGETATASELSDAFESFKDLIDSWSIRGLLVNKVDREIFTLTTSKQSYSMGPLTADFATERPSSIVKINIIQNNAELPVDIITAEQWANIVVKNLESSVPYRAYVENTVPFETINLWPIPSIANNIVIQSLKPLIGSTATINDILYLPPGYNRALKYNLAIDLAPEYGKAVSQEIASIATSSLDTIVVKNSTPVYMTSDYMGLAGNKPFNIYSGE